ncbi:MAG: hypothetical protein R3247_03735, partial [Rhodothermales bacterium]|nr:hypothetical protein [Rhodothermales bacterium]
MRLPPIGLLCLLALGLGSTQTASAQFVITRTSSPIFYIDSSNNQTPKLRSGYVSYAIQNSSGTDYDDIWVDIGSFSGGVVGLASKENGIYHLGPLMAGETRSVFFYLTATGTTASTETHTVSLYDAKPPGTALASTSFGLTVENTQGASANKVNTTVATPNPGSLGGLVIITVEGNTGTVGGSRIASFTPASFQTWSADSYKLVETAITFTGGNTGTYDNTLYFTFPNAAASDYTAVYTFRAAGITAAPDSVSPVGYIQSGNPIKHTDTGNFATLEPIQPADNTTTLAKSASVDTLIGSGTVTYTLTLS